MHVSTWTAITSRLLVESMTMLTSFRIAMITTETHVVLLLLLHELAFMVVSFTTSCRKDLDPAAVIMA